MEIFHVFWVNGSMSRIAGGNGFTANQMMYTYSALVCAHGSIVYAPILLQAVILNNLGGSPESAS